MTILKELDLPPQYLPRLCYHQQQQQQLSSLRWVCRLNQTIWFQILSLSIHPSLPPQQVSQGYCFLHASVRMVSRDLYSISMHLLRRHKLQDYAARIQKPYSSDPLNQESNEPRQKGENDNQAGNSTTRSQIDGQEPTPAYTLDDSRDSSARSINDPSLINLNQPPTREVRILDLFIAASMTVDAQAEESELILISDLDDLFGLYQPQSRLEDLVHRYGLESSTLTSTPSTDQDSRISFSDLSVKFSLRRVSIKLPFLSLNSTKSIRKSVVEVERSRDQRLEHTARQLVVRLGESGLKRRESEGLVWYE